MPVSLESSSLRRALAELAPAALVAAVASLAIQWVINRLNLPQGSQGPVALSTLAITTVSAGLLTLATRRRWRPWTTVSSWVLPGGIATLWLSFMLAGSRLYLGGLSADQTPRTQYLSRLADSPELADLNYAGAPPFYPAGWFWVGGRFANLFGMEGWAAYKPYAIMTVAVAAAVAFVLWSVLVPRRVALLLALVSTTVGLAGGVEEPYSWAMLVLIPPLAVIALKLFTDNGNLSRGGVISSIVLIGGVLGVSAAVYTLVFGLYAFAIAVLAIVGLITIVRQKERSFWPAFRTLFLRLLGIGCVALPFLLAAWLPYFMAALSSGAEGSTALRYLPWYGADFPLPMFDFSVPGVICLIGTGWILFAWRENVLARALGCVALLCYAWYALSTLALVGSTTLLAFRIEPLLKVALSSAGVLCAVWFIRWILPKCGRLLDSVPSLTPSRLAKRNVVAGVLALLCIVSVTQEAKEDDIIADRIQSAMQDYDITGSNGAGVSNESDDGYWLPKLSSSIESMTGKQPSELTVLTTYGDILAARPYHSFQATISGWANPLGDYNERAAKIDQWAASKDSSQLTDSLQNSEFPPPQVFVLRKNGENLDLQVTFDVFPRDSNVGYRTVSFDEKLFDAPAFTRQDVGPFAVITRSEAPSVDK